MGRSTWRATSCRTCIARKVKCDKTKPNCTRCQSSGRSCGGYSSLQPSNFLIPRKGEQHLAKYQDKTQLISQFLDDYLPPKASGSVIYQSPLYWAETFLSFLDSQSSIVSTSLSALTLTNLAGLRRDGGLAYQGRYYYGLATQQICALREVENPTDLIRTSMILALYELYNSPLGVENAWHIHVQAAYNLLQQPSFQIPGLSEYDMRRLCTVESLRVCITGQSMPNLSPYLRTGPSANVFDKLLGILCQVVQLHWILRRQAKLHNGLDELSAGNILQRLVDNEERLSGWYHGLQSESFHQSLPLVQPENHFMLSVFASKPEDVPEMVHFTNPSSIPLLLLYWLGLVAVYASMTEILRVLVQSDHLSTSESLQQRFRTAEALCSRFVNRISQCQAGCAKMGRGTVILAAASSLAARQICLNMRNDLASIELNS